MGKFVVVIAYVIDSEKGSESGVAWNALNYYITRNREVLLVTQPSQLIKEEILFSGKVNRLNISPRYGRLLNSLSGGVQLTYLLWCYLVSKELKRISRDEIDLVHHVTFAGDWNPTALIYLDSAIKKVWGPIGGSQKILPIQFAKSSLNFKISEIIRFILVKPIRYLVKIRLQNNNTTILAMNQEVKEYFRNAVEVRNFVFRDVIFEHPQSVISKFSLLDYSHFYFGCGRLIPLKNWSLAIKALKFTHDQYPLIIAGEGKDLSLLKRLAKRHGVRDRVVFLGALSRGETLTLTKKAKCFVFPSVRDSFSSALAEAVHLGTPIACLGTSGNLAVLRVGGPSMEPKKNLTAEEFACLMENPIQFSKLESFRYDDFVSEMDQAINVSE